MKAITLLCSSFLVLSSCSSGDHEQDTAAEAAMQATMRKEAEIKQAAQSYVEAINQRDLQAIAAKWNDDSIYRNPVTGELIQGREGIKNQFSQMFQRTPNGTLSLNLNSVSFPNDEKAIGEGEMTLSRLKESSITRDYKITFVRKNGKWLIYHVSQIDLSALK